MKKIAILLLIAAALLADDIYLKNGDLYKNVEILKTENRIVFLRATTGEFQLPVDRIQKIDQKPFDSSAPSVTVSAPALKTRSDSQAVARYPNGMLWPITVLAGVVALDAFAEAGDVQQSIDELDKAGMRTGDLEAIKTRKLIVGGCAAVAAVLNTVIVMQRAEFTATDTMIGLAYNF